MIDASFTSESSFENGIETSKSLNVDAIDDRSSHLFETPISSSLSSSSEQQQALAPYRLQLEGRRRLNTLERIRERRQNTDNDTDQLQQQIQQDYTLKPEEVQDPIIRRALERFDEKNRALTQAKPTNYDDIEDPITRRALMRLETNLKRAMPPTSTAINHAMAMPSDVQENWFTNSYTLGSLQSHIDQRFLHTNDASLPPPVPNHKTSHVSMHQRFSSASSSDNKIFDGEHSLSTAHAPIPSMNTTSNHECQQPTVNVRQRSRSQDMLATKDLSFVQTTDFDDNRHGQLQRNYSSNDLPQDESSLMTATGNDTIHQSDLSSSTATIKSQDYNNGLTTKPSASYIESTNTSVDHDAIHSYADQTSLNTSDLVTSRNLHRHNDLSTSSAFVSVPPSTNAYYSQQALPAPSYTAAYISNSTNQTNYSDDPM
jgi:hypothetical protein